MTIKDLPEGTNLQEVKVVLPDHIQKASSLPYYDEVKDVKEVYLQGWTMGDFFVKVDKDSKQIYPMFWVFTPKDIDEWEVVQE